MVVAVEGLGRGGEVGEDKLGVGSALGELFELGEEGLSYSAGAWTNGGRCELVRVHRGIDS